MALLPRRPCPCTPHRHRNKPGNRKGRCDGRPAALPLLDAAEGWRAARVSVAVAQCSVHSALLRCQMEERKALLLQGTHSDMSIRSGSGEWGSSPLVSASPSAYPRPRRAILPYVSMQRRRRRCRLARRVDLNRFLAVADHAVLPRREE